MIFFLPTSFHQELGQLSTCPPMNFLQMWLNSGVFGVALCPWLSPAEQEEAAAQREPSHSCSSVLFQLQGPKGIHCTKLRGWWHQAGDTGVAAPCPDLLNPRVTNPSAGRSPRASPLSSCTNRGFIRLQRLLGLLCFSCKCVQGCPDGSQCMGTTEHRAAAGRVQHQTTSS